MSFRAGTPPAGNTAFASLPLTLPCGIVDVDGFSVGISAKSKSYFHATTRNNHLECFNSARDVSNASLNVSFSPRNRSHSSILSFSSIRLRSRYRRTAARLTARSFAGVFLRDGDADGDSRAISTHRGGNAEPRSSRRAAPPTVVILVVVVVVARGRTKTRVSTPREVSTPGVLMNIES